MPQSKKDESNSDRHRQWCSRILRYIDYALGFIDSPDSDSDSSDFNEDYHKIKPPPKKISGSMPNLLHSNSKSEDESNTITIDRKSGAVAKNDQTDDATITQSVSKANLNKKKRKKAKNKAKLTLVATSEFNSVLTESEQNTNLESELIARPEPSLSELKASTENLNSLARLETPFIEVKRRKPKKRTNSNTSPCTPELCSKNVDILTKTKQQAALEERIKSQIRTPPLRGRNLTLDFSSFFNTNLQGEQLVETDTEAEPQVRQQDCVVKVGKTFSKNTTRKQYDADPQVDCKPQVEQPDDLERYNFVTGGLQELLLVDRSIRTRLIPGSSKMEAQLEQQDCVIKIGRKPSRKRKERRSLSFLVSSFSSFINLNLQGNQTLERLLEIWT